MSSDLKELHAIMWAYGERMSVGEEETQVRKLSAVDIGSL